MPASRAEWPGGDGRKPGRMLRRPGPISFAFILSPAPAPTHDSLFPRFPASDASWAHGKAERTPNFRPRRTIGSAVSSRACGGGRPPVAFPWRAPTDFDWDLRRLVPVLTERGVERQASEPRFGPYRPKRTESRFRMGNPATGAGG